MTSGYKGPSISISTRVSLVACNKYSEISIIEKLPLAKNPIYEGLDGGSGIHYSLKI